MTVFVSFEGGDGTGKSTQVEELVRRRKIGGFNVVSIYEPGSTHLGDYLRQWLKKEEVDVPYSTELFLFAAALPPLAFPFLPFRLPALPLPAFFID